MALKTHILVRRWNAPGVRERGETACGEPLFKSLRLTAIDREWESSRRIGGALAVASRDFYPDHDACAKCRAKWDALEV